MNEQQLQRYLEFKERFKEICESGDFHSDIEQWHVEFLFDIIEDLRDHL